MSDTIRNLLKGREAVEGVLPATMTQVLFQNAKPTPKANRHLTKEYGGSPIMTRKVLAGSQHEELTIKSLLYYDWIGWDLCSLFNAPTTANHSGETTVKDHTFKRGLGSVPTLGLQWYDGVVWWQMLGASVDEGTFSFDPDKPPELDLKIIGRLATQISAPTVPALASAAYNHPVPAVQQGVTLNGSAYYDIVSGKLVIKNARKPQFGIRTNADMQRAEEGEQLVEGDIVAFFKAYTGSLLKNYLDNSNPGAIVITLQDAATTIGTAAHPTLALTVPVPLLMPSSTDPMKATTEQQIKFTAGLDTSTSTDLLAVLTNEVTSYAGS